MGRTRAFSRVRLAKTFANKVTNLDMLAKKNHKNIRLGYAWTGCIAWARTFTVCWKFLISYLFLIFFFFAFGDVTACTYPSGEQKVTKQNTRCSYLLNLKLI